MMGNDTQIEMLNSALRFALEEVLSEDINEMKKLDWFTWNTDFFRRDEVSEAA